MDGPGPSERVVAITTSQGREEELVVHDSAIHGGTIEVGQVGERDEQVLIELPQESASGNWRVWVPSSSLE
jgi:hypothetical protein